MTSYSSAKERIAVAEKLAEFLKANDIYGAEFARRSGINSQNINNYIRMANLPTNKNCEIIIDTMETWHQTEPEVEPEVEPEATPGTSEASATMLKHATELLLAANRLNEAANRLNNWVDQKEAKQYLS